MLVIRQRGREHYRVAQGKRYKKKKRGIERKKDKGGKVESSSHASTIMGYITCTY